MIVPTGIATDATTAPFFASLVADKRLSQLVDFENRAGLFPAVDSRMKFCILTLGRNEGTARFAFFLTNPAQLAEPERNFTLTPAAIARLNPNTRTTPIFRSRADAELTAKIYENVPVLIDEAKGAEGNPWGLDFHSRMWHMSEDAEWFRPSNQLAGEGFHQDGAEWVRQDERFVPLYEAKMVHHFDHRWATYEDNGVTTNDVSLVEKTEVDFEPNARYWLPFGQVKRRLSNKEWSRDWLLGWRDITNATNDRMVIAAIFPRAGSGDTLLLMFPPSLHDNVLAGLVGNLSSVALDYAARQKIGGTHLKFNVFFQLPILPPSFYTDPRLAFITPKVLELIYTSHALAPFARDLGYDGPPFAWDEARRAALRADLDAFYACAYGLTRDELRYILDPADIKGPDYPSETFRVLKEKEQRLYNEYRTRRLVLAAWDRMEAGGEFAAMGM